MSPAPIRVISRYVSLGTVLLTSLLLSRPGLSQDISRRPLEHKDYDVWNTMAASAISNDGQWAMYQIQSGAIDGEATLHLQNLKSGSEYVIRRGTGAKFTYDSRFAVYRITPEKKKLKQLRKEKKEDQELPQAKLQILDLKSGSVTTLENADSFKVPEENGSWVACLLEKGAESDTLKDEKRGAREVYEVTAEGLRRPAKKLKLKSRRELARERGELEPEKEEQESVQEAKPASESNSKEGSDDDEQSKAKKKDPGTPLVLIQLESGVQRTFPNVTSYGFSKNGKILAFATSGKAETAGKSVDDSEEDEADNENRADGVHVIDLASLKQQTVAEGEGEYKNLAFKSDGLEVAFLTNKDDYEAETPSWAVYHWTARAKQARAIAAEGDQGIPEGWWVSPNSNQRFTEDGRRLYFETAPIPEEVLEQRNAEEEGQDDVDEEDEDQAKLDIWHWQDPQLQPEQLLEAEIERKRNYRAAYDLKSKKIAQLATRQMPFVEIDDRSSSPIAIANTNMRYRKTLSWDVPGPQDTYLVELNTGKRRLVLEAVKWSASLSPEGNFIAWFDAEQKAWFAKPAKNADAKAIQISRGIKFALYDELNDRPMLPSAYGSAGWLTGDRALLVYDRYDIWQLDPTGQQGPVCITAGVGRANDLRFRYLALDRDERSIDPEKPMMLSAFNRESKASGFYRLDPDTVEKGAEKASADSRLRPLIMLDEQLSDLKKAEHSDRILFTRSTFRRCPDLWSSDISFAKITRVSDMNPQQEEYSWGDAELVHWNATDGQELDGILIKPDGFDASKKYPMMVYFYERSSDRLHRYYPPAAGRSIICHSFYVSRGYLVFIPDIPYTIGEPGPSAASSVIPGVEQLIEQGFVDPKRIGMQGHSWGGYQSAYLVTKTDLFACAESGAPVSNMTSAYGGIRWGSGLSRMFQYERTQSRIGEDLWTGREKYIANSPLFFADKINTPLLILHNDEDGAVPWYQGIELFVALRRLEKPAWMLNYNGDPHWVMGEPNRRDFATRMQQFFDHYLLDAPEPEWMAVGVAAVDKGKKFGLELLEPENTEPKGD